LVRCAISIGKQENSGTKRSEAGGIAVTGIITVIVAKSCRLSVTTLFFTDD